MGIEDLPSSTTSIEAEPQNDPPATPNPASDFPDGGLRAWSVVVGAWFSLFVSFGWITCIGVFQTYYQTHQLRSFSPSAIGWIPSVETFVLFIGSPVFGKIFDSYGPTPLLICGCFFHVFGLFMLSLSTEYYQIFLAQSVCSAIGASAVFWACNNAVGTWFSRRRGLALGIVSSGSSVGGVWGTAAIPSLIARIGFGWTIRVVAFLYLFFLCISIATVRSRLVHKPSKFAVVHIVRPLREGPVLALALAAFFFFLGVFLPYNFMVVEALDNGMRSSLANDLLVVLSTTSVLGRIIPGWAGDRWGRFNVTIGFTYLSTVLVLAMWIPARNDATRVAFAALYGFSSGTFVSMVPTLIAQVCSNITKLGAYMGATYLVLCPAILMAQPIAGALVSIRYVYMKIFCGIVMFIGGTGFIVARAKYGAGKKGMKI